MKKLLFISVMVTNVYPHPIKHTIFAHGIVDGPDQMNRFKEAMSTQNSSSITFPDAYTSTDLSFNTLTQYITNLYGKNVNRSAMYMGQNDDLEAIAKELNQIPPQESVILYGCSRGAAALLTYLGTKNPQNITALILDACPQNIPKSIEPILASLGIPPAWAPKIFSLLFPKYSETTAITPDEAIAHITNKNLPILLIHSKQDTIVPYIHSINLYQKLRDLGFRNVHLVLTPGGKHSFSLQDPMTQTIYLQAVHSFYKKYNLPYNSLYAQTIMTETLINQIEQIEENKQYEKNIEKCYQKIHQKQLVYGSILTLIALSYFYLNTQTIR